MINYFKQSFRRKIARRITKEYPPIVESFNLEKDGIIDFANWSNPLIRPTKFTQPNIDFFRQYIQQGDIVIDIGTNIGDTTVPMALAAGKKGITLGFDPNPFVFKILEANADLNKDKTNIIPYCNAITTKEDEFYFISSEASFGNGGISPTKESIHGKFIYPKKIKGINLNDFLEKNYPNDVGKLSFIKIDTEGYDKEIIKSIIDLIKKYKPVIVAESFGASSNDAKMELYEIIKPHGYTINYFEDFDKGTKTIEIKTKEEMTNWKDTINICATPET